MTTVPPRSANGEEQQCLAGDHFGVTRKSYSYLSREERQSVLRQQSYASRGSGVYWAMGDHRIEGRWFIHHEAVVGAFAPH